MGACATIAIGALIYCFRLDGKAALGASSFFFPSEALFYPGLELPSAAARGPVTLPSRRDASCFQKFTGEGLSVLMGRETHGFFGGAGNKVP